MVVNWSLAGYYFRADGIDGAGAGAGGPTGPMLAVFFCTSGLAAMFGMVALVLRKPHSLRLFCIFLSLYTLVSLVLQLLHCMSRQRSSDATGNAGVAELFACGPDDDGRNANATMAAVNATSSSTSSGTSAMVCGGQQTKALVMTIALLVIQFTFNLYASIYFWTIYFQIRSKYYNSDSESSSESSSDSHSLLSARGGVAAAGASHAPRRPPQAARIHLVRSASVAALGTDETSDLQALHLQQQAREAMYNHMLLHPQEEIDDLPIHVDRTLSSSEYRRQYRRQQRRRRRQRQLQIEMQQVRRTNSLPYDLSELYYSYPQLQSLPRYSRDLSDGEHSLSRSCNDVDSEWEADDDCPAVPPLYIHLPSPPVPAYSGPSHPVSSSSETPPPF
ncbi:hypothetical protein RI367_002148 [Sorochytrium milnesiophthora]